MHRADCKSIERDRRHHASEAYGPYRSVEDALAEYLDMNMVELGHGLHDIKIHSCTKEDEVEIGKPERTIDRAGRSAGAGQEGAGAA